ncbi:hypothetical protein OB03_00765 [Brevundimonas sp. GN22]
MHTRLTALLGTTILAGALISAPAIAQEVDTATQVDEIVVTGTRIVRPNQTSATAVQSVNSEAIALSGQTNVGDILRSLPSAGQSALTPSSSNFLTANNGVTSVNLRSLGEARTLVLVNGRRYIGGVPGTSTVDFATLPTEFIDRIDVVTGGASSVYGSDALAGVVNIITQRNYQGFEAFGQYGITERGDGENYKFGFKLGSNFADDRGNFVASLSYNETHGIYARDRGDRGMALDGTSDTFKKTKYFSGSSVTPGGVAIIPGLEQNGVTPASQSWTLWDGKLVKFDNSVHGYNRQDYRALMVPTDGLHLTSQARYDYNNNHSFFMEASAYRGRAQSSMEPTGVQNSDLYKDGSNITRDIACTSTGCVYGIPILSEAVPVAIRDLVRAATPGLTDEQRAVGFNRRFSEAPNRSNIEERNHSRIVAGLQGKLGTPLDLSYEMSFNWGHLSNQRTNEGALLKDNLINAIDVVKLADGSFACRSELARAQGCLPIFVFEEGGASKEAMDYVQIVHKVDNMMDQKVINGFLSGTAFELPAGPLQFVVGGEYRREESELVPDVAMQRGLTTTNLTPITRGSYDVSEGFIELNIPLLADLPWAHQLDLSLSARVSDYSTVGKTDAYAASLEWKPVDFLKVRSQYARSVRAPNIAELYAGVSQTYPTDADPCRSLTIVNGQGAFFKERSGYDVGKIVGSGVDSGTVGSNAAKACLADPTVAARVARDGHYIQTQSEAQGYYGFNSGNEDLEAETSTSFTAGLLFNPRWNDWWSGLSVSVDYFQLEIEGMIGTLGRSTSLNECYVNSGGVYDPNNIYCKQIIREDKGASVGSFREVNSRTMNLGENRTRGFDLQANYSVDLTRLPYLSAFEDAGQLAIGYSHQHLMTRKTSPLAGGAMVEFAGRSATPKNVGNLNLVYRRGPLTTSWKTRFMGESCYRYLDRCDPKDDKSDYIGLRHFSDLQVRYDVTDKAEVFVGVDNIFDEYVYIAQTITSATGWTTDPSIYDGLGRRFNMGMRMRF